MRYGNPNMVKRPSLRPKGPGTGFALVLLVIVLIVIIF